ncbi:MAG: NlpC/P60 family protein [Lawsonibacter sp.]
MGGTLARGALFLIQRMAEREARKDGLSSVMKALVTVLISVALVLCMIVYVLTSPVEFAGELGAFQKHYSYLVAPADSLTGGEALSEDEIAALVSGITDPDRKAVVETALSLVGKVPYFWGGKSGPGWNEEWNTLKRVTASGSSTSGTYQPYGLDCTGFVHWVYWTALGTDSLIPAAYNSLWYGTDPIDEAELLPGDIVYKDPPTAAVNHVGIYLGKGSDGKNIYIHCSFSGGGVTMNSYSGFRFFRRPPVLEPEE